MATSVDVLIENMILEPDETNGGVSTNQYITPDVVKGIDVGRQDAGNDVLTVRTHLAQNVKFTDCEWLQGRLIRNVQLTKYVVHFWLIAIHLAGLFFIHSTAKFSKSS